MKEDDPIERQVWKSPKAGLEVLAREKAFVGVFCLSAALTALALTYVGSEKYEASTAIFYRPQEIATSRPSEIQSFGAPMPAPPFKVIGRTLQEVAVSEVVLRPIVLELGLDHETKPQGGAWYTRLYHAVRETAIDWGSRAWMLLKYGRVVEEDPLVKALIRVRDNVSVSSEDSYVFYIRVRDKSAERAAQIVDKLAQRLVDWLRDEERKPGDEKRQQLGEQIADKQEEIDR